MYEGSGPGAARGVFAGVAGGFIGVVGGVSR